jgi:hypothetical protein
MERGEENPDSENSEERYFKEKQNLKAFGKYNHPGWEQSG